MGTIPLNSRQIHLWFAFPDEINQPELLQQYQELMNEEEKIRQKRFHFQRHQHQYLVTRALVRTVLSRYASISPADWQFQKNKWGRPEIKENSCDLPLKFNLSHTEGLIVCAVSLGSEIGVDIENRSRREVNLRIADRYFAPNEVVELRSLPESQQMDRFFDYWTLKESYIKACGKGLAIPLNQFCFNLKQPGKIEVSFESALGDSPDQWKLYRFNPTLEHWVALAVRCDSNQTLQLKATKLVPLSHEEPLEILIERESGLLTP